VEYFSALAAGYEPRDLAILQYADKEINKMVLAFQNLVEVPDEVMGHYQVIQGVLYRNNPDGKPLLVVPSIIRKDLLEECHDTPTSGHHGVEKTYARLSKAYYWRNMEASVRAYVQSCVFCQAYKSRVSRRRGKLYPVQPPKNVGEQYGIDHIGPFKKSAKGNRHVIVAIDYLSRWVEADAVPDTSSRHVTEFIDNRLLFRHGWFRKLISDQGTAFTSREFEEYSTRRRFKHALCSAEHPESNGLCEKVNRAITATLAAFVNLNHNDWDTKLQEAIFAINSAKQATTQKSPFELVYGRVPVTPDEMVFPWLILEPEEEEQYLRKIAKWRQVSRSLILAQQRKSRRLADRFRAPDQIFKLGDLVLVARKRVSVGKTKKFICRAVGPYQIVKRVNRVCYTVEDLPQNRRSRIHRRFNAHVSLIKRYHARSENDWLPEEDEGEDWGDPLELDSSEYPEESLVQVQDTFSPVTSASVQELQEDLGDWWEEEEVPAEVPGISSYGRVRKSNRDPNFEYQPP